jgi:nitroimidazol reductase NimA-like FMN-containing flavoprotein (pyridoxamine 5'-phosphate oxidase superfamily)
MLDEPILGPAFDASLPEPAEEPIVLESIQALVHHEPFAVLCTQADGQPYGSLVAFAFSEDLKCFVFATPVATRKYRLLSECDHVALLVDNRGRFPDDMMKVSAITVTGQASLVEPGAGFEQWAGLLTARHPYLKSFVHAPSTALFRVDVVRYLHVTRFQEVRQWIPTSDG